MSSEIPPAPENQEIDSEMDDFKAGLGSKGELITDDMLEHALLMAWAVDVSREEVAESIKEPKKG